MGRFWIVTLFVYLVWAPYVNAKECCDTLSSTNGDKAVITYDIKVQGNVLSILFLDSDVSMSAESRKKVRKKHEIDVVWFDRTGSYNDVSFSGLTPASVMIPAELGYHPSKKGYYRLDESPRIDFAIMSQGAESLVFPLYLASSDGGKKYKIISRFDDLKVFMPTGVEKDVAVRTPVADVEIISLSDIDQDDDSVIKIVSSIKTIRSLLDMQESLPFSETLQYEIARLRLLQDETNDRKLLGKIGEVLIMCEQRRSDLAAKADSVARKERIMAEMQQKKAEEEAKAQQDSLAVAEQKAAEQSRKQKTWMVVAGAVLAVFGYAGNQVLQHFRNISNQRNLMEMQESIARQAESKARGQARRYVSKQIKEIGQKPKNKSRKSNYTI